MLTKLDFEKLRVKELVVKSNELNFFALFNSSLQLKLFSKIITMIRKSPDRNEYVIPISDILRQFGISKTNYTQIKNLAKKMEVFIDMPREDGMIGPDGYIIQDRAPPFKRIRTENPSTITFEVNENLKSHLVDLSGSFSSYNLENILSLSSKASIRLYEILNQWRGVGKKTFSFMDLKKMIGVSDNKQYKHFKSAFLIKAQKELKEKTDISFVFEEVKEGRRVKKLIFTIENNQKGRVANDVDFENLKIVSRSSASNESDIGNIEGIDRLIILGISKKDLEQEVKKIKNELKDPSDSNIAKLIKFFLSQDDIKDVISNKNNQVKSIPGLIYNNIKKRRYLNQETLDSIIFLENEEVKRKEEELKNCSKFIIRNDEKLWHIAKKLLEVRQELKEFPSYIDLEKINFSLLEEGVAYFIIRNEVENYKFIKNNFLKYKSDVIKELSRAEEGVIDIKVERESDITNWI